MVGGGGGGGGGICVWAVDCGLWTVVPKMNFEIQVTFRTVKVLPTSVDSQPCADGSIVVQVMGQLQVRTSFSGAYRKMLLTWNHDSGAGTI